MSIAEKQLIVAENVSKVYDAGKKAEHDAFWDGLQNADGSVTNYSHAFARWPESIFKPKYNIYPVNGERMFDNFNTGHTPYTNLTALLDGLGVKLDTSRCTNFKAMFYFAFINRVPELDTRAASDLSEMFHSSTRVITIDKIILKEDGSQSLYNGSYSQCFYNCTSLVNVEFEGAIGSNIDFRHSTKLSAKSMASTVLHLSDTASGKVAYFSQTAVDGADWSSTDYSSWDALVALKPNWTFVLS